MLTRDTIVPCGWPGCEVPVRLGTLICATQPSTRWTSPRSFAETRGARTAESLPVRGAAARVWSFVSMTPESVARSAGRRRSVEARTPNGKPARSRRSGDRRTLRQCMHSVGLVFGQPTLCLRPCETLQGLVSHAPIARSDSILDSHLIRIYRVAARAATVDVKARRHDSALGRFRYLYWEVIRTDLARNEGTFAAARRPVGGCSPPGI